MDAGKHSSCLTVTTGEWVCLQRKAPDQDRKAPTTTKWMVDVTTALAPTLTAADRCDRCGARAYVRARLTSGGELLFCAHHGREHLPKLQDVATNIQDETDRLTPTPVGADMDAS
jgi:hypothetical protein